MYIYLPPLFRHCGANLRLGDVHPNNSKHFTNKPFYYAIIDALIPVSIRFILFLDGLVLFAGLPYCFNLNNWIIYFMKDFQNYCTSYDYKEIFLYSISCQILLDCIKMVQGYIF